MTMNGIGDNVNTDNKNDDNDNKDIYNKENDNKDFYLHNHHGINQGQVESQNFRFPGIFALL